MPPLQIVTATSETEIEAVQQLCRDFVSWLLEEFPEKHDAITTYFEPVKWHKTLIDLPDIHARPKGAMLLATFNGNAVGCIMYHQMEPGIAEIKRLFVSKDARGTGAGKALVAAVLERITADGYNLARLDTTHFLTAAVALYKRAGFKECGPFIDFPKDIQNVAVFMERPVGGI